MSRKQAPPFALLVLPPGERRRTLLAHLETLRLTAKAVDNCRAVREFLEANPRIDIIITQVSMSDGNWCDVLSCVVGHGLDARVVVSSSAADERFWSEVLWRGVYDVLVEPYDRLEVSRVVDSAIRAADHPRMQAQGVSGRERPARTDGAALSSAAELSIGS